MLGGVYVIFGFSSPGILEGKSQREAGLQVLAWYVLLFHAAYGNVTESFGMW
jgi:hypothetical protein